MVCHYCSVDLKVFNNTLKKLNSKLFISNSDIDFIIQKHNTICLNIFKFNKFWRQFIFIWFYTATPITQLTLHQLFFVELDNIFVKLLFLFLSLMVTAFGLTILIMTASVNYQSNISYKLLNKYLLTNSKIKIKHRLKVLFPLFLTS